MIDVEKLNDKRAVFGELIRMRRESLKLTQVDIADRAGIGVATIQRIESGKFFVSMKQLWMLCDALDMGMIVLGNELLDASGLFYHEKLRV